MCRHDMIHYYKITETENSVHRIYCIAVKSLVSH